MSDKMNEMKSIPEMRQEQIENSQAFTLENILATLKSAKDMKNNGMDVSDKAVIQSIIDGLESQLDVQEKSRETEMRESDEDTRNLFPGPGEQFAETEDIRLIVASQTDASILRNFLLEEREVAVAAKDEAVDRVIMDVINSSQFSCIIYERHTEVPIGYCSIKNLVGVDWELAIAMDHKWQGQGYGYWAIKALTEKATELTGRRFYKAVVDLDNYASQKLLKRLGAYPDGIQEYGLHGADLEQFRQKNMHIIDDRIREIAYDFCMDPEDLIGYVLVYRIDASISKRTDK